MLPYLFIVLAILCVLILVVVFGISKTYFTNYAKKSKINNIKRIKIKSGLKTEIEHISRVKNENGISQKRQNVLTALTVLFAAMLLFTILFSLALYRILGLSKGVKDSVKIIIGFVLCMLLASTVLFALINKAKKPHDTFFTTKNITRLAIFTALSVVLYMVVKFPLPFIFPSFLDIQISDMPALLAGFMMGPEAGAIVIILKCLIKLPFTGTGGVGELGDLILGLVYVVSASVIYRFFRTKKGAIIALATGSVLCVITALFVNRFILIPFYTSFMFPWEILLGMVDNLYPSVTKASFYSYYLWLAVLPFNILRCLITVLVTFFMYKPTQMIFGKVEKSVAKRKCN